LPRRMSASIQGGLELEAEGAFAEGEFGPVQVAVNDPVAQLGRTVVTGRDQPRISLATKKIRYINLVLDPP